MLRAYRGWGLKEVGCHGGWDGDGAMVQAYDKTSDELSYPSVVHFTGHVQLKGVRPQTVEAYEMMVPLLARWAGQDPEELDEERVREFFLHLLRKRQYSSQSIRQARVG